MATRAPNHTAVDLAHLVHPLTDHSLLAESGPLVLVGGEGCELIAEDGRRFLDGSAGLWTVNLGHGRRDLIEAASAQLARLPYAATFGGVAAAPTIELAERIAGLAPEGLSGVFFVSGGSEANESAIKLARRHWARDGRPSKSIVLAHDRGYHGLAGVTTTVDPAGAVPRRLRRPGPGRGRGPRPLHLPLRRRRALRARPPARSAPGPRWRSGSSAWEPTGSPR